MAFTGAVSKQNQERAEFYVRVQAKVSAEELAVSVRPMGKIESRERGSSTYVIQLNPGSSVEKAKSRLNQIPGLHILDADEEPVNMRSIRSLDRKIAHLKADEARERLEHNNKKAEYEKEKADYLQAYLHFVQVRAFPNDTVDWDSFERGRQHAARMNQALVNFPGSRFAPGANSWSFMGPTNLRVPYQTYYGVTPINGRVNAVAFDPTNPNIFYAGGAQGGLWKTTDAGVNWSWLSSSWTQLAVNNIVVDPNNSNTIYVARGDFHGFIFGSYGIMKSTDGGQTWTEIAINSLGKVGVNHVMIDPANSQILIAGTGDYSTGTGNLFRSTDGGSTWTKLSVGGQYYVWPTIASSVPSSGNVRFYAVAGGYATNNTINTRLYKSDDHGATWQALASPVTISGAYNIAYEVATSPTNSKAVYVLDSENTALYTSGDQGATWTDVSSHLPQGPSQDPNFSQNNYDYHLECGSKVVGVTTSDVLYLGEINVNYSVDGGLTWSDFVPGGGSYSNGAVLHNDQHCLAVCPTNPNLLVFSNDGGVYSVLFNSAFSSATVTPLSKNLGNSMFTHIAMHPTNANYALGGTQDNASPITIGDLSNWFNVGAGDGGGSAINQTNPLIQYTSVDYMTIYRTGDGWNTRQTIGNGSATFSGNLPFVPVITIDSLKPNLMYSGSSYLYQWNENTQSWNGPLGSTVLTNGGGGRSIQAIAVSPTDSNRIYTGSDDGALWMTTNQGSTWKQLSNGTGSLPKLAITSITVSATNPSDILVGLSGSGSNTGHIFRCSDTQATTPVFSNVAGSGATGLPDVSLNTIARDPLVPGTKWWVGTDVGVFVTSDSGNTWSNAGSALGLPSVIVDELVAVPATGYLNAGTYGRGMWRLQIGGVVNPTLTTLTLNPSTVSAGSISVGTVALGAAAPAGGILVTLASGTTSVATVPASVTIPAGSSSATFNINTNAALAAQGTSVISATYNGVKLNQTLTVTVLGVTSLSVSPNTVLGSMGSTGTVTLSGNAPTGGTIVTLNSNSSSATIPAAVTVPSGSATATFAISTNAVSAVTTATITGTLGSSSKNATLTINPAVLASLSLAPNTLIGGSSSIGTVTLNGAAPTGGTSVVLSSSSASATPPASVVVPAGATSSNFTLTTVSVATTTTATISASQGGVTQTAPLTILTPLLQSVSVSPTTVAGGSTSTGTVTLSRAASAGGVVVSLTSSSADVTVPATVTVAAGSTTVNFNVGTVGEANQLVDTITASQSGTTVSTSLTVQPVSLVSVSLDPATVAGGTPSTGTVTLSGIAPSGGSIVKLSSTSTSATVPASVTVAAGSSSATFTINTKVVSAATSVKISGQLGTTIQSATLTIQPSSLDGVSITPTSVIGGSATAVGGTVYLTGPAPSTGAVIKLTSGNTKIATVLATIKIPSGAMSGTFAVTHLLVASETQVSISAAFGGVTRSAVLDVKPYEVTSLVLTPTSVNGGTSVSGVVTINTKAGAKSGAIAVKMTSSSKAITFPLTVSIPVGADSAKFTVNTVAQASNTTAILTAKVGTSTQQASVTVVAPVLVSLAVSPTTVKGSATTVVTGTVTISSIAPTGGAVVKLSSTDTTGATVPVSVTIPAGKTTATFKVSHVKVTSQKSVTLSATYSGITKTATVTVTP